MSSMMLCKACRAVLPETALDCPVCAARKSRTAFLEYQKNFRAQVIGDKALLVLAEIGTLKHIQFIGDPAHGLCGSEITQAKRRRLYYSDLDREKRLCLACMATFSEIYTPEAARCDSG